MFASTSLNGVIGHAALIVGLAACVFGALGLGIATVTNDRRMLRSIPNYSWMALVAAVVAVAVMERALITRDFSLAYIQQVGSRDTPVLYNMTALWSALEGSILLWLMILAIYTAVIMRRYRRRLDDPLLAWALVVMFVVTAFFFLLSFGPIDAFKPGPTPDFNRCCLGPNPLLQNHILVLFHPPILYLGFVGFTVPFAFAIAALITGRVGEGWLLATRQLPSLAHRHRLSALCAGAGAAGHVAGVEHQPAGRHVLVDDPGHVHHAQRRLAERARLQQRHHRAVSPRLLRDHRRRVVGTDCLAR